MSNKSEYVMVDPPWGWQYGFPKKILRADMDKDSVKAIVDAGYPKELTVMGMTYRCWEYLDGQR